MKPVHYLHCILLFGPMTLRIFVLAADLTGITSGLSTAIVMAPEITPIVTTSEDVQIPLQPQHVPLERRDTEMLAQWHAQYHPTTATQTAKMCLNIPA